MNQNTMNVGVGNIVNVLLYSKYSPACNKFIEMLNKIDTLLDYTSLVCVDHPDVRKRVMNHSKLSITCVPALLRIDENTGHTDLYEGSRAFEVLNVYYLNYLQNLEASLKEKQEIQNLSSQNISNSNTNANNANANVSMNNMNASMSNMNASMNGMSSTNMSSAMTKPLQTSVGTLLNLDDTVDSGDANALNTYLHIPTQLNNQEKTSVDRSIKKTNENSVATLAMQMQKERESETTPSNIPPGGNSRFS
jgi:hypothetical protein